MVTVILSIRFAFLQMVCYLTSCSNNQIFLLDIRRGINKIEKVKSKVKQLFFLQMVLDQHLAVANLCLYGILKHGNKYLNQMVIQMKSQQQIFSQWYHILASGSDDKSIRLQDVKTGLQKAKLDYHSSTVCSVNSLLILMALHQHLVVIISLSVYGILRQQNRLSLKIQVINNFLIIIIIILLINIFIRETQQAWIQAQLIYFIIIVIISMFNQIKRTILYFSIIDIYDTSSAEHKLKHKEINNIIAKNNKLQKMSK
ncbi:unnamed protein product [Paramecium octaurelia]|uniref:Transmembrane protein n=1 Tax=Paramecium octaurelia TaxID=43137 RepID=A0A8S1Y888_PAROT|nr:unnamed protein product [Paramecium octaurelia]